MRIVRESEQSEHMRNSATAACTLALLSVKPWGGILYLIQSGMVGTIQYQLRTEILSEEPSYTR